MRQLRGREIMIYPVKKKKKKKKKKIKQDDVIWDGRSSGKLAEAVTFEQKEGKEPCRFLRDRRGNSKCKGPEASLAWCVESI